MYRISPIGWLATGLLLLLPTTARSELQPLGAREAASANVSYDGSTQTYTFQASGSKTVTYQIVVGHTEVQSGLLRISAAVDRGPYHLVMAGAGTRYRNATGQVFEPGRYGGAATLVEHRLEDEELVLVWNEQPGAHPLQKTARLRLVGLSLAIRLQSGSTWGLDGYAGVSLGHAEPQPGGALALEIPYLPIPVGMLPDGSLMTAYLDPSISSAVKVNSALGLDPSGYLYVHSRSLSLPDTAGVSAPLDETAYLTLSSQFRDVFPAPTTAASPYRSLLSDKLVLDVWGMHRSFGVPEGVLLLWQCPVRSAAHVALSYSDANAACGDGVVIIVRRSQEQLARLVVRNGDTQSRTWETDLFLSAGEELRFMVDRAGNNYCDATQFRVTITAGTDTFDSVDDFSSIQGERGFFYREFVAGRETPLVFDAGENRWEGQSPYSIIAAGYMHPGIGATAFADAAEMVRRYIEYGLDRLAIIFHVWQHWGYDQGLPDHHPANAALGSGEDLAGFIAEARAADMLVALHENYTDMYPNNPPDYPSPLYDATAIALDQAGNPKLGWYHPGTHQQAFVIASSRMTDFARQESSAIAADYGPNAAYIDVSTGWSPGRAIDHDAAKGKPPTLAFAFQGHRELFDYLRGLYGGPLLGEGGEGPERYDSFLAGVVDAVERQTERRQWARLLPEYELRCVRPWQLNHGMGYYSRYFVPYGQKTPQVADVDLDQYRASELAFGHSGFLGDSLDGVDDWLDIHAPEYWLLEYLQSEYADAALSAVSYFDGDGFVDLKTALRSGLDLARARLLVEYEGLLLFINRDRPQASTNSVADFGHLQGEGGWGYYEDRGVGLEAMHWDPESSSWRGVLPWSIIRSNVAHPDGAAVVRSFTVPAAARLTLKVSAGDADLSCGDGALVRLLRGGNELWRCDLPGDLESPCPEASLELDATSGEVLSLRIEPKANINCDSTFYELDVRWRDQLNHDWTVNLDSEEITLPPSGFFGLSLRSGAFGGTVRLIEAEGETVDFVVSPRYEYARSRSGRLREIYALATDGALARLPTNHGNHLHGKKLTRAMRHGQPLLELGRRADFNLRFLDGDRAVVSARRIEGNDRLNVLWSDLPTVWKSQLAAGSASLLISPCDFHGTQQGAASEVALDAQTNAHLEELIEGQFYLLRLEPTGVDGGPEGGLDGADGLPADGAPDGGDQQGDDVPADAGDGVEGDGWADAVSDGNDAGGGDDAAVGPGGCGCSSTGRPSAAFWAVLVFTPGRVRARWRGFQPSPTANGHR